jgi:AraC-like DNA-binding protein
MLPTVCVNEIASVYRLTHQAKTSYRRDWGSYALTIKKIGSTVYETTSGKYITDRSHILLLRKGLSCVIHPEMGECITIEFEGNFSDSLPEVTSFEITRSFNSIDILDQMEENWSSKSVSYQYACMSGFYQVLSLLERDNYPASVSPSCRQIQPSLDYMEQNYGDPDLGNDDLAKCVNLSVSHFRKIFRETLDKSPMQYLRTVRIKKAKELLTNKGKNITETSEIVGFSSPFYFDVVFKKETGMAPTDYMRSVKF